MKALVVVLVGNKFKLELPSVNRVKIAGFKLLQEKEFAKFKFFKFCDVKLGHFVFRTSRGDFFCPRLS